MNKMKPRQFKKLCKKVVDIAPRLLKDAWLLNDEPFAIEFLSGDRYQNSTMSGLWVVGGELDYSGEATEVRPTFWVAVEKVICEFGTPTYAVLRDDQGNELDVLEDWPKYHKRLTGMEVIKRLREIAEKGKA